MLRARVSSSNIASIGYDSLTHTLEVEFNNDTIYQYFNVPQHIYEQFMRASSHGTYLNENIKDRYEYRQIK